MKHVWCNCWVNIRERKYLAGYDNAVKDQVAETAFMNGIHQEIALQIRSSPLALNLAGKVDYAHRYWTARHPITNTFEQILAPNLRNTVGAYKTMQGSALTKEPIIRPATVDWNNIKKDTAMDDLT